MKMTHGQIGCSRNQLGVAACNENVVLFVMVLNEKEEQNLLYGMLGLHRMKIRNFPGISVCCLTRVTLSKKHSFQVSSFFPSKAEQHSFETSIM